MRKEFFYSCLILTLAYNGLYKLMSPGVVSWHPFYEISYDVRWYFALLQYNLKPILYIMALLTYRGEKIIIWYLIYELVYFIDFFLFYSQLPFRTHTSIFMGIVTISYYMMEQWQNRKEGQ